MNFNFLHLRSLKTRLTLFMLVIFLICIWSLAFYTSHMLREDMQHMLSDQQFSSVSLLAAKVNQEIDGRLRALEKIVGSISPAMMKDTAALQTFLEQRILIQSLFNGGAFVTETDGTATASIPLSAERIGSNYMDRDYIAATLNEGKSTIGQPVMGRALYSPVFAIAVPIRDLSNKVIGAMAGVTDLGKLNFLDNITEGNYGKTGGYFLVAPQYRLIVTASDKTRVLERFPAPGVSPVLDQYLQGKEGSDVYVNPLGVEVLGSAKRIPVVGWFMGAILPTKEAFAPIRDMQLRMLLSTIFMSLLVGVLTRWILTSQLSPMFAAARILAIHADTNLPLQPLPITSQDEIGELIGGFNHILEILKQRDEALQESEEKHKRMIANISDVIAIMDSNGTLQYKSPNIEKWFGWQQEDLVGTDGWETVHSEDIERIKKEFFTLLDRDNSVVTVEYRYKCKDGSYKLIELTAVNLTNDPIIRGVLMNYHDITARKQIEDALLNEKNFSEAIIESIPGMLYVYDDHGTHIRHNKRHEDMTGYSAEELSHLNPLSWYDDKADVIRVEAAISDVFTKGHGEVEVPMRIKNGEKLMMHFTGSRLVMNGKNYFVGVGTDITERKQAEEALLRANKYKVSILESISDAFFSLDNEMIVTYFNRAAETTLGKRQEEVVGHRLFDVFTEARGSIFEEFYSRAIREKIALGIETYFGIAPYENWYNVHVYPHEDGIAVYFQVVTDRKRVEEELFHLNETLEQRVAQEVEKNLKHERLLIQQSRMAAMGEMIGNIAHQWRQPLNALGLLIFNIKDAYQFNKLDAAYLDQAVADGRRMVQKMSTTISDFSNFFRPNKEVITFSALEQVREAIALVDSSFQSSNISIHIDAPQDLKILGFPNEYSQVLLNLLSNAKEAILSSNQKHSGRVDIVLTEQDGQGCVSVCDNGGGIPADILDRIFDPYFSTKEQGTGIGLYMTKMIIERNMNGSITAKNVEGGAEFMIASTLANDGSLDPS